MRIADDLYLWYLIFLLLSSCIFSHRQWPVIASFCKWFGPLCATHVFFTFTWILIFQLKLESGSLGGNETSHYFQRISFLLNLKYNSEERHYVCTDVNLILYS